MSNRPAPFLVIDYIKYFNYNTHYMDTGTISATELKRHAAEVINTVYYNKRTLIVERHGKPIIKIIPVEIENSKSGDMASLLDKYFGAIPDFPEIKRTRQRRKVNI